MFMTGEFWITGLFKNGISRDDSIENGNAVGHECDDRHGLSTIDRIPGDDLEDRYSSSIVTDNRKDLGELLLFQPAMYYHKYHICYSEV